MDHKSFADVSVNVVLRYEVRLHCCVVDPVRVRCDPFLESVWNVLHFLRFEIDSARIVSVEDRFLHRYEVIFLRKNRNDVAETVRMPCSELESLRVLSR